MNFQNLKERKLLYILLGTLIVLFVLLLTLLSKRQRLEQQIADQTSTTSDSSAPSLPASLPLPRAVFSDYTLNTTLPTLPTSVKLSDLKTSYTTGEALNLSTKIGFSKAIVDEGVNLILVTDQAEGQQGLLSLNKINGNFIIVSETGYPSGVTGGDATTAARSFLNKLGILDDTMVATAQYKRASYPGVTFVEFHLSWEKLGLPLLNPVGALNLDETKSLADVKLGYIDAAAPDDPDITESSDGSAGKVRPNDFNTITVAVFDENSKVMTVTSNIKIFNQTQEKLTAQTLKTPEEALEELKSGKASFSLVKPTGEGVVEMQNVFPDSQAVSQNAVINEVILTYLEEVGQKVQNTLYPHYLFRGTTTLSSGYQAQFVEPVPAVKQINTLGVFAQNSPPTVYPGQGSTLQYGTFNWLTPGPNTTACAGLTQLFALPNGGYIGWYPNQPPRNWYYVPPPGEIVDAAKLKEVKSELRRLAMEACKNSLNDPTVCAIDPSLNLQTACYYVTTASPFIYVYSSTPKQMQIGLSKAVIYADPAFSQENLWSFSASPEQTLTFSSGLTRQKLYYEYDKSVFKSTLASLKKNSQGFVLDRSKLEEFVSSVAEKLGLNSAEKESLLVEMTRETNKLSAETLKIGLLDRQVLDKVLPVSITPQPQSYYRLFFSVTSTYPKEKLETPTLQKIAREGDTVVELGVLGL